MDAAVQVESSDRHGNKTPIEHPMWLGIGAVLASLAALAAQMTLMLGPQLYGSWSSMAQVITVSLTPVVLVSGVVFTLLCLYRLAGYSWQMALLRTVGGLGLIAACAYAWIHFA